MRQVRKRDRWLSGGAKSSLQCLSDAHPTLTTPSQLTDYFFFFSFLRMRSGRDPVTASQMTHYVCTSGLG